MRIPPTGHRAALAVLLCVALAGCASSSSSGSGPAKSPTRAPTASPAPTSPTTSGSGDGIPAEFPLAQGLSAAGDATVTPPQRDVKGVRLERACWGRAWPGAAEDRLVVQQVAPEESVTRELALYRNRATAAAVAGAVRAGAARCRRLPADRDGPAMDVSRLSPGAGHRALAFAETTAGGEPGGSVFVLIRVGRAVLAVEDSSEWTRTSAAEGVRGLELAERGVVSRMCLFTAAGC